MKKRILHLTLHRQWFDAIANGTKTEEYREIKPYWQKRLDGKTFDEIHFRNGYSPRHPFMRVKCLGIAIQPMKMRYAIQLGPVLEILNYVG